MNSAHRVLIIGGGLGGLALAQGLARRGIAADVFERSLGPDDTLAGYGIHINADGWAALGRCLSNGDMARLDILASHAGAGITFRDEQLRTLADIDPVAMTGEPLALAERRGIGRLALRSLLAQHTPNVQWGRRFVEYREDADGVTAIFEDGSEERGTVLVGADASNSRVRHQRLPSVKRLELDVLAIAGRFPLEHPMAVSLPTCLRDGSLNNIVPHGRGWMFTSAWLLGGHSLDHPGENSDYVVFAYILDRSFAPPNIEEMSPSALRDFVLTRTTGWAPHLRTLVEQGDLGALSCIPLRSMPHLDAWAPSRVTLIGDAIHNMTPMAGIGANTALRDAALLAEELAAEANPIVAIGKYEEAMRAYANPAIATSRENARRATKGSPLGRRAFRGLLKVAEATPPLKRMMFAGHDGREADAR
jgi:2-polyprenyl-6-methoxyphenol hydroxylase-like FAD-dependent oxidoreductase